MRLFAAIMATLYAFGAVGLIAYCSIVRNGDLGIGIFIASVVIGIGLVRFLDSLVD